MKKLDKAVITYFQPKDRARDDRKTLARSVYEEVARHIDADIVDLYDREPDEIFNGLVISVGGDGAFLGSTHTFRNLGNEYLLIGAEGKSLSAYAQSSRSSFEKDLKKLFSGESKIVEPHRIGARTDDYESWHCVNEVLIGSERLGTMFEYSLEIAQCEESVSFSDGRGTSLLFSTSYGSSAYALSAGGPIVDRNLDTIVVVPESPNKSTVANKRVSNYHRDLENLITPYVLHMDTEIMVKVKRESQIVPDGRAIDSRPIEPGTKVRIEKRPKIKLIKLK